MKKTIGLVILLVIGCNSLPKEQDAFLAKCSDYEFELHGLWFSAETADFALGLLLAKGAAFKSFVNSEIPANKRWEFQARHYLMLARTYRVLGNKDKTLSYLLRTLDLVTEADPYLSAEWRSAQGKHFRGLIVLSRELDRTPLFERNYEMQDKTKKNHGWPGGLDEILPIAD